MIVVFHVRVSHSKRKWQHSSTFSYDCSIMQRCLLQKSPHPSLPLYPSFSISILYVAIYERLLLLLMGDVNHRCAYKTKKHVHCIRAEKKGKMRNKDRLLLVLLLLLSFLIYRCCDTHISSNACTSHTFCLLFLLSLFRSYICVISIWWYLSSTGDDEKRAWQRCLWMHARANLE